MQNFQDTFETHKRPFFSAFSICMTVPLSILCSIIPYLYLQNECYSQIFMKDIWRTAFFSPRHGLVQIRLLFENITKERQQPCERPW